MPNFSFLLRDETTIVYSMSLLDYYIRDKIVVIRQRKLFAGVH